MKTGRSSRGQHGQIAKPGGACSPVRTRFAFYAANLFDCWLYLELNGFPGVRTYIPPCISSYEGADITAHIGQRHSAKRRTLLWWISAQNGEMALQTPARMCLCSTRQGRFLGRGYFCGTNARTARYHPYG
jgi:uncharacterized 2Fe-2S/4Fe-4S cluster protein (DUF4445 family)